MKSNSDLLQMDNIRKLTNLAAMTLAAEEADRFLDYVVDESVLKNQCRIIRMNTLTKNIRAIGLGTGRFLKPADTFKSSDYLKALQAKLITLTAEKCRGCVVIYDDDLEDCPEGDALVDHIMRMIAEQTANELEEAWWIGDTQSVSGFASTDIRHQFDGWRYQFDHSQTGETYANSVAGACNCLYASNSTSDDFDIAGRIGMVASAAPYNWEFKQGLMLQSLDSKYKRKGLDKLRFYSNDLVIQNYIDALTARSTPLGDMAILGDAPIKYGRVPHVAAPIMSATMEEYTGDTDKENHDSANGTYSDCLLTYPNNLIAGIKKEIKLEAQREAGDEATYFYYTVRTDVAVENVNAAVLLKRLVTTGTMVG